MASPSEAESEAQREVGVRVFDERPTEPLVLDAYRFAALPLSLAAVCGLLGWAPAAMGLLALALFVGWFFRNPVRLLPADPLAVIAPADGKVIEVAEVDGPDGEKRVRVGIFLSIFNVHVNRAPVAGTVRAVERSGDAYLAAFDPRAEQRNVRCDMTLETAAGETVRVSQITGLIARRIVCHPEIGEWLGRGTRYGLIRFGSRTDVLMPIGVEVHVALGQRVRGGSTMIARLESETA